MASNNLNKFKPGNTAAAGNTIARGQRSSRMCTQTLISILNEAVDAQFPDKTKLYEIGDALVNAARGGDVVAIKYIMDRVDGTPTQMVGEDPDAPLTKRPIFVVEMVRGGAPVEGPGDNAKVITLKPAE